MRYIYNLHPNGNYEFITKEDCCSDTIYSSIERDNMVTHYELSMADGSSAINMVIISVPSCPQCNSLTVIEARVTTHLLPHDKAGNSLGEKKKFFIGRGTTLLEVKRGNVANENILASRVGPPLWEATTRAVPAV